MHSLMARLFAFARAICIYKLTARYSGAIHNKVHPRATSRRMLTYTFESLQIMQGTKRVDRIEENAAAVALRLTVADLEELNKAFPYNAAAGPRCECIPSSCACTSSSMKAGI